MRTLVRQRLACKIDDLRVNGFQKALFAGAKAKACWTSLHDSREREGSQKAKQTQRCKKQARNQPKCLSQETKTCAERRRMLVEARVSARKTRFPAIHVHLFDAANPL